MANVYIITPPKMKWRQEGNIIVIYNEAEDARGTYKQYRFDPALPLEFNQKFAEKETRASQQYLNAVYEAFVKREQAK